MAAQIASFEEMFAEARKSDEYWAERATLDFIAELVERLNGAGISRAEFARRLGTSGAYVTKVLRGDANLTIATMTKLARASGGSLQVGIVYPEPATSTKRAGAARAAEA